MSAQHTPGPWVFEPHALFRSEFDGLDGEDMPVGYISDAREPIRDPIFALHDVLGGRTAKSLKRDACLAAAAPDLLEVAKLMLAASADAWPEAALREAEGAAHAAIAKAEGRS